MADKKIPDLTAATTVNDTDVLELCQPGVLSEKVTALQLKNYAFPSVFSFADGWAIDNFQDYALGAITVFDKGYGFTTNGVGTGCSIVARTQPSGQNEQRLSMTAGQYGRKMPWGNDWGRIQLAWLWRINRASTFTSALAYFGICSGTTNMAASATTTNFTGFRTPSDASAMVFATGTRADRINVNPAFRFMTRRVTTDTDRTSGAGTAGDCIVATSGYLSAVFFEIARPTFVGATSITYSFGRLMTTATRTEDSLQKSSLQDMIHGDMNTTIGGGNSLAVVPGGVANTHNYSFDESTGELDTINLTWPEAFDVEFGAIGVRKVY